MKQIKSTKRITSSLALGILLASTPLISATCDTSCPQTRTQKPVNKENIRAMLGKARGLHFSLDVRCDGSEQSKEAWEKIIVTCMELLDESPRSRSAQTSDEEAHVQTHTVQEKLVNFLELLLSFGNHAQSGIDALHQLFFYHNPVNQETSEAVATIEVEETISDSTDTNAELTATIGEDETDEALAKRVFKKTINVAILPE